MSGISAGKFWGLRRLADDDGLYRMVALDQRPPIMNLIKQRLGLDTAPDAKVSELKRAIAAAFAPHASALLVDPIWAYPFLADLLSPRQGLVITLEDHRFEDTPGGRKSSNIEDWSVAKIRRMGGDAVKVLAWYHPAAEPEVAEHQRRYVRRIGEACRAYDIPFVLELILHPLERGGGDYVEDATKRPELVVDSVRTFAAPEYGVDLFKLESPIPADGVPEPGDPEVQRHFDALGEAAGRPWVMLSLGATKPAFERVLHYAFAAGASGFLAGRAVWADAADHYPDLDAVRAGMEGEGVAYLDRLSALARERATPWLRHPVWGDGPRLADAGFDFPTRYGEPG